MDRCNNRTFKIITVAGITEIREGKRLIGIAYEREDGAWEALRFEPAAHRYDAFDSRDEAIAWISNISN